MMSTAIVMAAGPAAWAETKPDAKADSKPDASAKKETKKESASESKSESKALESKPEDTIITQHPNLAKFLPTPADDHLKFGFGVAPVELLRSSTAMEISIFQLHWSSGWLDWELINASFNMSFSSDPNSKVSSFTFRNSPKFRLTQNISIGPMLGVEFVSFPNVQRELRNNQTTFQTQHFEPFSALGPIYGGELAETFHWGSFDVRLCQLVYIQNYRSSGTSGDWYYYFKDNALNGDQTPLAPGPVFLFEFSLLY